MNWKLIKRGVLYFLVVMSTWVLIFSTMEHILGINQYYIFSLVGYYLFPLVNTYYPKWILE